MTRPGFIRGAFALFVSLLVAACGSKQEYYRLSAEVPAARTGESSLSIGVSSVTLPGYIDRSELVFQNGPNEFQIPPNVSWAGSLRDNVAAVLARDLQQALGAREVLTMPWPSGASPHRRVALDIRQFHGISGSEAILEVSWRIENENGATLSRNSGTFHESINGDGYAAVVAAESRLLVQCAAAIAPALR
jgi:uncharacterized lipoprotein YmbA